MASHPDQVKSALEALQTLLNMFRIERFIYLAGSIASLGLLVYATLDMMNNARIGPKDYVLLFGSGGLFAVAGAQVTYFLRQGTDLIVKLTLQLSQMPVPPAATPAPAPAPVPEPASASPPSGISGGAIDG